MCNGPASVMFSYVRLSGWSKILSYTQDKIFILKHMDEMKEMIRMWGFRHRMSNVDAL